MNKIAKFEKISIKEFTNSLFSLCEYNDIKLPKRATIGSAGYDFYSPFDFILNPQETIKIPTGIRVKMDNGYVLLSFPRSSLGLKYRLQLDNSVGVIDSDYYYSDNEGHIYIKLTNDSKDNKILTINKGEAIAQGLFLQYGITIDDDADKIRNGGFGSTN
jgi:dUTP pyrophosphatase